jgi:uncharacterized protein (TIGR02246 family)
MAVLSPDQVRDELAVRALVEAFADAVTRRDAGEAAALFVPGGTWDVPGVGVVAAPDQVVTTLTSLLESFPFLVQMVHGTVVALTPEGAHARSTIAEMARGREGEGSQFVGVYHDRLTRTAGGGWRFAARRFRFLYRGRADLPGKVYEYPADPDG